MEEEDEDNDSRLDPNVPALDCGHRVKLKKLRGATGFCRDPAGVTYCYKCALSYNTQLTYAASVARVV